MRVDTQFDDKDMREKMRLCNDYSPLDFGIEAEFCMPHAERTKSYQSPQGHASDYPTSTAINPS